MPKQKIYPSKNASIANHSRSSYRMYQTGGMETMSMGAWDWDDQRWNNHFAYQSRMLIKFDIPQLPPNAKITSAKFNIQLRKYHSMGSWNRNYYEYNDKPTVNIHRLTRDWHQGIGDGWGSHNDSGVTWRYRHGNRRNLWMRRGGDFESAPIASATHDMSKSNSRVWSFDLIDQVNDWIENPEDNHGILLKLEDDETPGIELVSNTRKALDIYWNPYVPHIEIEYNTPPERPHILTPGYNGIVSPQLSDSLDFKWKFVDTFYPHAIGGKTDIIILLDTSGSMSGEIDNIIDQIESYLDRLDLANVDYRVGIVEHGSGRLKKKEFSGDRSEIMKNLKYARITGADYMYPQEAILSKSEGGMSFSFRSDAKVHFLYITDEDRKRLNSSAERDVVETLNDESIVLSSIVSHRYRDHFRKIAEETGGQVYDLLGNFGEDLPFHTKSTLSNEAKEENDTQSKAELRIWRINSDSSRSLMHSTTINGSREYERINSSYFNDGESYEWEVRTWDSYGEVSPYSYRSPFKYKILPPHASIPVWGELPSPGETIRKDNFNEIKSNLKMEASRYDDYNPSIVDQLFTSETTPTKKDSELLNTILSDLYSRESLRYQKEDFFDPTVAGGGIRRVQELINDLSESSPRRPQNANASYNLGDFSAPSQIHAESQGAYSKKINLSWEKAVSSPSEIEIQLGESASSDVRYYKLYYSYRLFGQHYNVSVYLDNEEVKRKEKIRIPLDYPVSSYSFYVRAYDKNGRASDKASVNFRTSLQSTSLITEVSHYVVEAQRGGFNDTKYDPNGSWWTVYEGPNTSFTHRTSGRGTYWYRIKAVDKNGNESNWTYSTSEAKLSY